MRALSLNRRNRRVSLLALLVLAAILGQVLDPGLLSLGTTILLYLTMVEGWNVLGGYAGYLNFGTAGFFGIGAYTTGILVNSGGWPPLATLPVAALAAAAFACLVGLPTLRLRGAYFAILTLLIGFFLEAIAFNWTPTGGATGLFFVPPTTDPRTNQQIYFYLFLAMAAIAVGLVAWLAGSRFADPLRAIREDEDAARVLGVDTTRYKFAAFLVGALAAGLVGGLQAYRLNYIDPASTFDLGLSIDVVLMAFVGGMGTWQGPVIGTPLVLALAEALRVAIAHVTIFGQTLPSELSRASLGILLVVVVLFAPNGVMGLLHRRRGRQLRV